MAHNSLTLRAARNVAVHGHKLAKNGDLILADISISMQWPAGNGQSKWHCLKEALVNQTGEIQIMAFGTKTFEVDWAEHLPRPTGSTALHLALAQAVGLEPMHVLVISDGEPNSSTKALAEAAKLATDCIIDTLYIGPGENEGAITFMRTLAEVGRGRAAVYDLAAKSTGPLLLTNKIAGLLAAPSDEVIKL